MSLIGAITCRFYITHNTCEIWYCVEIKEGLNLKVFSKKNHFFGYLFFHFFFFLFSGLLLLGSLASLTSAQVRPPNFSPDAIPETSFTCEDKITGGYYADQEADCQLFHVCVQVSEYEVRKTFFFLGYASRKIY